MLSFKNFLILITIIVICIKTNSCFAIDNNIPIVKTISYFEDKSKKITITNATKQNFEQINSTPYFGLSNSVFWFKIVIKNNSANEDLLLEIQNTSLSSVTLYKTEGEKTTSIVAGEYTPFSLRLFQSPTPLFQIIIPKNKQSIFFIRISSNSIIQLPLLVDTTYKVLGSISFNQYIFGIYIGIIFVMFFYNLFIYITVKDSSYLYYVIYILIIGFTQACLKGYAGKFLWPENTWLIVHAQIITIGLSGVFSVLFAIKFLNAKLHAPLFYKFSILIICCDIVGVIFTLLDFYSFAQQLFQIVSGIGSILIMFYGIIIYKKGYKPALFLNISWAFFLSGVIIYILKDVGLLNYNIFTSNSILIGSAIEATLLSFALADKINVYKAESLKAVQEKADMVREQNVMLEAKVTERTVELQASNTELNKTLVDLKEAESHLVEAEKMASLGQLTAGIAHEINNPINFVTSNVAPLKRDVDMLIDAITTIEEVGLSEGSIKEKTNRIEEYKEEIDFDYLKIEISHLLKGIHEGASRTAEIVKGLRVFSRLDEDDLKKADINEGLESTLVIANNLLNNKIKLDKQYGNIPLIECYPGKLNQVFLNIISNGIYAIKKKFEDQPGGILKITTCCDEKNVFIKIEDNGIGMDEVTKKKIFEPFFTTKPVGEGTGLGMSITYNTIKKHNGQIHINSTLGSGTEFILELQLQME